ncbi:MAG: TonB-dependent receptor plug domain-containing protein, partial [Stenotrophomonas maltophilia]
MTSSFRIALALAPLCTAFPSAAQSLPAPAAPPTTALDTVQVQAQAYDIRRDDTATRIVIGAAALRQYGDLGLVDALKRLPGVTVGTGAPGRSGALSLRGLGAGYTQILLNGQKAPTGFDLDSLTPEMVERVEIIRAPTADQRGEAIAGSINIVLAAGARTNADQLTVAWGSSNGRNTPSASWQRNRRAGHRSSATRCGRRDRAAALQAQEGPGGHALRHRHGRLARRHRRDRSRRGHRGTWGTPPRAKPHPRGARPARCA